MAYAENTQVSKLPPPSSSSIVRFATTTIDKSRETRKTAIDVSARTRYAWRSEPAGFAEGDVLISATIRFL
jgi:hypothetical protein